MFSLLKRENKNFNSVENNKQEGKCNFSWRNAGETCSPGLVAVSWKRSLGYQWLETPHSHPQSRRQAWASNTQGMSREGNGQSEGKGGTLEPQEGEGCLMDARDHPPACWVQRLYSGHLHLSPWQSKLSLTSSQHALQQALLHLLGTQNWYQERNALVSTLQETWITMNQSLFTDNVFPMWLLLVSPTWSVCAPHHRPKTILLPRSKSAEQSFHLQN